MLQWNKVIAVLAHNLNKLLGQGMPYLQAAANNHLPLHTHQLNTVMYLADASDRRGL